MTFSFLFIVQWVGVGVGGWGGFLISKVYVQPNNGLLIYRGCLYHLNVAVLRLQLRGLCALLPPDSKCLFVSLHLSTETLMDSTTATAELGWTVYPVSGSSDNSVSDELRLHPHLVV